MRNLHLHIREEYGIENVKTFWQWENLEYNMAAFQNHRIFSLRCLKEDLIPVSVKLKSNIRTPKARLITKKVERALLNERIRSINNTLTMMRTERDTCMNSLFDIFSKETMEECRKLITLRETYFIKVKKRQISKLERLCQRNRGGHPNIKHGRHGRQDLTDPVSPSSNTNNNTSDEISGLGTDISRRWVVNLSNQPLTEAEYKLLAHGPNFAITSRSPPTIECVTAIEEICQKLEQGEVEELRGEVKTILKKTHPPKPNISREEQKKAIENLRKDNTRIVLAADRGVALVVMNRQDYEKKAEELLN